MRACCVIVRTNPQLSSVALSLSDFTIVHDVQFQFAVCATFCSAQGQERFLVGLMDKAVWRSYWVILVCCSPAFSLPLCSESF